MSPYITNNKTKNISSIYRSIYAIRNHIYRIKNSKNNNKIYSM